MITVALSYLIWYIILQIIVPLSNVALPSMETRSRLLTQPSHPKSKASKSGILSLSRAGVCAGSTADALGSGAMTTGDSRADAFMASAADAGVEMKLELRSSGPPRFSGLFTPEAAEKGQVGQLS